MLFFLGAIKLLWCIVIPTFFYGCLRVMTFSFSLLLAHSLHFVFSLLSVHSFWQPHITVYIIPGWRTHGRAWALGATRVGEQMKLEFGSWNIWKTETMNKFLPGDISFCFHFLLSKVFNLATGGRFCAAVRDSAKVIYFL